MSDSEEYDDFNHTDFSEIHNEIEKCKINPETAGMFVSGWDDADQDVDTVANPKANPVDHVLWAAEKGEIEELQKLLTVKPDLVHAQDSDGYTPLHRAAYSNHVDVISVLLSFGANVGMRTELGWTPLHSACNWNNYICVARLLVAGASPHELSDGGQSPLHLASAISHCKSTLILLLLQEDITETASKRNQSGETPEDLARGHGIYAPLFEMTVPAASYIRSIPFTCNPYLRD